MAKRFGKKKTHKKNLCPIHNVRLIRVGQRLNNGIRENAYDCPRCRIERLNGIKVNPEDIIPTPW